MTKSEKLSFYRLVKYAIDHELFAVGEELDTWEQFYLLAYDVDPTCRLLYEQSLMNW